MRLMWKYLFSFVILLIAAPIFAESGDDLGLCLRPAGKASADERITICTRGITGGKLNKRDLATTFNARGVWWRRKGDVASAIADFNEAIRTDPQFFLPYRNRGLAWYAKQEYQRAVADYDSALQFAPQDALTYYSRGNAWLCLRQPDRAIDDFNEALHLNPRLTAAYHSRGNAWYEKHEYNRAIADHSTALRLKSDDAQVLHDRGNAWLAQLDYYHALSDYYEAIRLNPQSASIHNDAAWIRATAIDKHYRDGNEAVKLALKASDLSHWKESYTLGTLGAAYAEAGNFIAAIHWQEEAIKLLPANDPEIGVANKRIALFHSGKPYRSENGAD